jgi:hypothetical protein
LSGNLFLPLVGLCPPPLRETQTKKLWKNPKVVTKRTKISPGHIYLYPLLRKEGPFTWDTGIFRMRTMVLVMVQKMMHLPCLFLIAVQWTCGPLALYLTRSPTALLIRIQIMTDNHSRSLRDRQRGLSHLHDLRNFRNMWIINHEMYP